MQGMCDYLDMQGAFRHQLPHLRFLGIDVEVPSREIGEFEALPLPDLDGVAQGRPGYRQRLEARLLHGLHDVHPSTVRRIGLHLFRAVEHHGPGCCSTGIDAVSRDLLADLDISPAWLVLLAAMRESFTLTTPDGHDVVAVSTLGGDKENAPLLSLSIALGRGVSWRGEGIVVPNVPDTIRADLHGRRLQDLVAHPVLDAHRLLISEIRGACYNVGYVPYDPVDWSCGFRTST